MLRYKWLAGLALIPAALILVACQPVMPVAPASTGSPLPATQTTELAQTPGTVSNQAPVVDAGAAQTITLPGVALLEGTVLNDDLPSPPGVVTTTWNVIDAAGVVTFTNAAALDTAVSFSAAGLYTLALTAGDGEFAVSDQLTVTVNEVAGMSVIRVPEDAPTIQDGINLANDGDLVLIAPGEYHENIGISGKTITLASWFYTTGDPNYINQTILDGDELFVIYVGGTAGPDTTIAGFTIRNGGADAVTVQSRANILYNHFDGSVDAIFYNSGGGLCSKNTFDGQIDDAIDLQDAVDVVIEDNIITNSHGNGIDIELNPYAGPVLNVVIRDNLIANNGLDGIQLIGWDAPTDRVYVIERNVIRENAMAGLGLVDGAQLIANNVEDYRGASLPERILLVNNTFIDNDVGVSGGDNLIALNNIFAGHPNSALSNVDGDSIAAHSLLWDNGENQVGSNIDAETTIFADPMLDANARLLPGSPAIDAGTATFSWNAETVLDLQPDEYRGAAPDIGSYETQRGDT